MEYLLTKDHLEWSDVTLGLTWPVSLLFFSLRSRENSFILSFEQLSIIYFLLAN